MHKAYTNLRYTVLYAVVFYGLTYITYLLTGDILIKTYALHFLILFYTLAWLLFVNINTFKVKWNNKEIAFSKLFSKPHIYNWNSLTGIYYCPKIGVGHLFIATDVGEFYSMPDVPQKLYDALQKYAKVEIKTIRHPMEVLPYLRERRKNARRERKRLSKRR